MLTLECDSLPQAKLQITAGLTMERALQEGQRMTMRLANDQVQVQNENMGASSDGQLGERAPRSWQARHWQTVDLACNYGAPCRGSQWYMTSRGT
jgi:hypothetical protein